jgi:hypothetical protein
MPLAFSAHLETDAPSARTLRFHEDLGRCGGRLRIVAWLPDMPAK